LIEKINWCRHYNIEVLFNYNYLNKKDLERYGIVFDELSEELDKKICNILNQQLKIIIDELEYKYIKVDNSSV